MSSSKKKAVSTTNRIIMRLVLESAMVECGALSGAKNRDEKQETVDGNIELKEDRPDNQRDG